MKISQEYMEEYVINPIMKKLAIMEQKQNGLEKKIDAINFNLNQSKPKDKKVK